MAYALKTTKPLVNVLRITDGEKVPGMGFIYGAMDKAKEEIAKSLRDEVGAYKEIWKIIDDRWEFQLHRHLHAAAYFLNPQIQYSDNPSTHPEIKLGFFMCMAKLITNDEDKAKADVQVDAFLNKVGMFSFGLARTTLFNRSPADWWKQYGDQTPQLQSLAIKILSLTCSSSGCERNWSTFNSVLPGFQVTSLNTVLAQGMNLKKKHEVEVLSAVVSSLANTVKAHTIVDVGSGQGYLAQVLSFQYQHSVVAIDACSHHGNVTNARAERIKKHYAAQIRKIRSGNKSPNVPKTITCRVMSIDTLKALSNMSLHSDDVEQPELVVQNHQENDGRKIQSSWNADSETSLVLAGLHACGDLSVTLLKTFIECEEVKAVVSIGCCYNLLSEGVNIADSLGGFPMSRGVKSAGFLLGKSSRDLACQSAERWGSLERDAGVHNFELHAFRAAFQMVLCKYYPEVIITSPSVGRQGKALRRQQQRRILQSQLHIEDRTCPSFGQKHCDSAYSFMDPTKYKTDDKLVSTLDTAALSHGNSFNRRTRCEDTASDEQYLLFKKFCLSGLCRLDLKPVDNLELHGIWDEAEPFTDIIGPYWSLRAALGPLLETYILLDRLLFLQEQGSYLEVVMLPIFDPVLSPRNVAIIAKRTKIDPKNAS